MNTAIRKKIFNVMQTGLGGVLLTGMVLLAFSNPRILNEKADDNSEIVRNMVPESQTDQEKQEKEVNQLTRIRYNNTDLLVDLGVGLWAVQFPVD